MSKFGHPSLKADGRQPSRWERCAWQPMREYRLMRQWQLLHALHELRVFAVYLQRRG
jgi:hypothetical protein